jgi:DNA-binding GntR family transcriptional regulator
MDAFLLSTAVIFVTELGDKSQLMAMTFAASHTTKNTSATPRFFRSVRTFIQNFADSPPPLPAHSPSTSRCPMYLQVAALLRDRIETREWPEHHRLRSEPDLARELGVSRGTLRKALDLLMKEGRLRRVQGRGTYVLPRRFEAPLGSELSTISEELDRIGSGFVTTVLAQELQPAAAPIAALLDIRGGDTILRLERLRSDDKGPIA